VSCAGLVPVMTLATQTGLSDLLVEKVRIAEPRIKSGSANPSPKLTTVIAGMCAGADCIDDVAGCPRLQRVWTTSVVLHLCV
jgi:hypothetical protein